MERNGNEKWDVHLMSGNDVQLMVTEADIVKNDVHTVNDVKGSGDANVNVKDVNVNLKIKTIIDVLKVDIIQRII